MSSKAQKIKVIKSAIRQAIAGGWEQQLLEDKWDVHESPLKGRYLLCLPKADDTVMHIDIAAVIFNQEFAKALWSDSWAHFTEGQSGDTISGNFKNHLGHLANMVVAVSPIKYLEQNIRRDWE